MSSLCSVFPELGITMSGSSLHLQRPTQGTAQVGAKQLCEIGGAQVVLFREPRNPFLTNIPRVI